MGLFKIFGKKTAKSNDEDFEISDFNLTQDSELVKLNQTKSKAKSRNSKLSVDSLGLSSEDESREEVTKRKLKARETERKIDAIEIQMSQDLGQPKLNAKKNLNTGISTQEKNEAQEENEGVAQTVPMMDSNFQSTIALANPSADLLGGDTDVLINKHNEMTSVPALEEAAVMYGTKQMDVTEMMLRSAIEENNLGNAMPHAWFMLFDFYQLNGNRSAFESLSIDYAAQYETSPPVWRELVAPTPEKPVEDEQADGTPSINFPSEINETVSKLLEKMFQLSTQYKELKLDFSRIKSADAKGCEVVLEAIRKLKKSKHQLRVVGAQAFADSIRSHLEVGNKGSGEAPWLMLMEVLQLMNQQEAFEEASMDYCITFEVSPPAFVAPTHLVANEVLKQNMNVEFSDQFNMPRRVEGKIDVLIKDILSFAENRDIIVIDFSDVEFMDFSITSQFLNGLMSINTGSGRSRRPIEFHEVNYLTYYLLSAMGIKNVATAIPKKLF